MESMDRDFPFFAGFLFAQFVAQLPFDEVEVAYTLAPESFQRYAYDIIVAGYRDAVNANIENGGEPFDVLFPEPSGMEQHRQIFNEKLRARGISPLEGLNQQ